MTPEQIAAVILALCGLIGAVALLLRAIANKLAEPSSPPPQVEAPNPPPPPPPRPPLPSSDEHPFERTDRFLFGVTSESRLAALEQRMTAAEKRMDALDVALAKLERDLRGDLQERRHDSEAMTNRVLQAVGAMRAEFGEVRKEFHTLAVEFAHFRGQHQRDHS